jgi:hypothetical protein
MKVVLSIRDSRQPSSLEHTRSTGVDPDITINTNQHASHNKAPRARHAPRAHLPTSHAIHLPTPRSTKAGDRDTQEQPTRRLFAAY